MKGLLLALALLVLVPIAGAHAAGAPIPPTRTPTATATATLVPSATPSPSPSPSPTAAHIGGTPGGSASCPAPDLLIPFPFTGGFCIDWWGLLGDAWDGIWSGLTQALQNAIQSLADAILAPLVQTPNPAANPTYSRIEGVLAGDATEVFLVLFAIGALWSAFPAMFGRVEDGVSLLLHAAGVNAALHMLPLLVGVLTDAANALATDIGHATIADVGHSGLALLLAPPLLLLAGLERAVSLDVLGIMYMLSPLAIACFVWPPARGIGVAWLRTLLYLTLLGPGYALATQAIVAAAPGATGLWGDVLLVGGLLVLDLVPAIVAGLLGTAVHGGLGVVQKLGLGVAKAASGAGG